MTIVGLFCTCLQQAEAMVARNEYWFCVRVLTRSGRLGWWVVRSYEWVGDMEKNMTSLWFHSIICYMVSFSKILTTVSPYLALLKYWNLYKLWRKIFNTEVNYWSILAKMYLLLAMCHPTSRSTLVEVMAWCLLATNVDLSSLRLYGIIVANFTRNAPYVTCLNVFQYYMSKFPGIYSIEQGVHIWGMTIVSPFCTCLRQAEPMATRNEYWFCVRVLTRSGRLGWWAGYMNGLSWWKETLWCHAMEVFSALLAICEGNPLVTGRFSL